MEKCLLYALLYQKAILAETIFLIKYTRLEQIQPDISQQRFHNAGQYAPTPVQKPQPGRQQIQVYIQLRSSATMLNR